MNQHWLELSAQQVVTTPASEVSNEIRTSIRNQSRRVLLRPLLSATDMHVFTRDDDGNTEISNSSFASQKLSLSLNLLLFSKVSCYTLSFSARLKHLKKRLRNH